MAGFLSLVVATLWIASGAALSTRYHLVFSYETLVTVPPSLEVLAVSVGSFLVLTLTGLSFPVCARWMSREEDVWIGMAFGLAASLPVGLCIARCVFESIPEPGIWEMVWYALCTGLALGALTRGKVPSMGIARMGWQILLVVAVASAFGWWTLQSHEYYQAFRLGFNDFGHFTQRIANTAAGRGFLLETPVLPTFWDHFNPGIALLVPLWWLTPSVYWIFALQSFSLASASLLLASIDRKWGGTTRSGCLWGLAWLMHPSVSQMNIAYTYGWHPVTVAIPILLLSYRLLLSSKFFGSAVFLVLACAFEEGVIVVVGCFAAAMFLRSWASHKQAPSPQPMGPLHGELQARTWLLLFLSAFVLFLLVYRFSGLATFQTGRFARLGGSAWEIVLSPIGKPSEFWGLLLRPRNASFLGLLFVPFVAAGVYRARWHLLAVLLPMGVLLVWEHLPAQCIAFQYTACLLPVLFLGCIESSHRCVAAERTRRWNGPVACLGAGWVLSLFVGQLPWSQNSLIDVLGASYEGSTEETRQFGTEDNSWLVAQIASIVATPVVNAASGSEEFPRVLATGRIAAHCVGLPDVETVGQFWQRRDALARLEPALVSPLLRYDVVVLDYRERFQQTAAETIRVREEALQSGFRIAESRFGIEVLVRQR